MKGADCWGWGSWKRAWDTFEKDGSVLLKNLKVKGLIKAFNVDSSYPYLKMLKNQIKGVNNSWAVRWHASCIVNDMYSLYPKQSLVFNRGMDGSGEHCAPTTAYQVKLAREPINVYKIEVAENIRCKGLIKHFLRSERSILNRMKRKFLSLYAKLLHSI